MKIPSHKCEKDVIALLKEGSLMEEETWMWLMKNTQKISSQLYQINKEKFHGIIYRERVHHDRDIFNDPNI